MTPRENDPRSRRGGAGTAQRPSVPAAQGTGGRESAPRSARQQPAGRPERRPDRQQATRQAAGGRATDRNARRAERPASSERPTRSDRPARSDRRSGSDRPTRSERPTRSDRPTRGERSAGSRRPARTERSTRAERSTRTDRSGAESRAAGPTRARSAPGRGKPSRPTPSRGRAAGEATPRARVVSAPSKPRRKPRSVRGRRVRQVSALRVNHKARGRTALVLMLAMLCVGFTKLVWVQTVDGAAYAAAGDSQRERTIELPAQRGSITDRNGKLLAFSIEGRRMAVRPALFVDDQQRSAVIDIILAGVKGTDAEDSVTRKDLTAKLTSNKKYVYVADGLLPERADKILADIRPYLIFGAADSKHDRLDLTFKQMDKALNAVVTERQDLREYPNSGIAETVIGTTGWDGHGLSGVETRFDSALSGMPGSRDVEVDTAGNPIPGTVTGETPATDGSGLQLTLDTDAQFTAEQMLAAAVKKVGAKGGNMLVTEAKTNKIVAMASYEPGKTVTEIGPTTISSPVEPGSVNKVVTFAAALEQGLITPETVLTVDGQITVGGTTVGDAWSHGPVDMTATGVLAKSSNVGTLMLAQQVGEKDFYSMLTKLGIGAKTGIQLNGESPGWLPEWSADPAKSQWSASTFANLPIGQGVSMTMIQLASMYQAIANDGVRIDPSLIEATTTDGESTPVPAKGSARVMSAKTAKTLREMLTATTQSGNMVYSGTAPAAAVAGYQVAGKTGTAQQVDEKTKAYSDSLYTTTFAGIIPADDPQYVIAISLDRPGGDREGGTSAAPLFHDYAGYLMDAMNVPPSATQPPQRELYVNLGG